MTDLSPLPAPVCPSPQEVWGEVVDEMAHAELERRRQLAAAGFAFECVLVDPRKQQRIWPGMVLRA